ncbi:MAG: hypothetical protein AAGJ82_09800, partial [Bacteroidota bacterium]
KGPTCLPADRRKAGWSFWIKPKGLSREKLTEDFFINFQFAALERSNNCRLYRRKPDLTSEKAHLALNSHITFLLS